MRITIASVPTDSRAQNYYKTKRRRKSRIRGKAAKRKHIFSKDKACACAGGICARGGARGTRVFIKLAGKREKRKNESGEHAGNRSGESAGGARESKRNDWTTIMRKRGRGNG